MEPRASIEQDQLRVGIHGMWASVAAEQEVPEGTQQTALRLECEVDGLQRDAGLAGDRGHRRRCVAPSLEQPLGRPEDLPARGGGLLAPARRVVIACLDRVGQFVTLSE